ncbi:hypothetical protein CRM22_004626 [Opisthorchis felineus]|uniref:EF-hand domain-containing protein n=1 Tax=Opisthorchis felineus TaxID=147828 RepID=A0A4S2LV94_OPIFE|nr:hypothetical protein CRM22_004626 [Opisthorchis felineus]TGZ67746.1 hypothetical protein CRM22_004626 [Opisthorchis felineus]
MASTKSKRRTRNRTQRYTSNVFSMFTEPQINEFKEAFSLIDSNKDSIIDQSDLEEIFRSLGKTPTQAYLDDMLSQAKGQINFTMFLTLFGEKMMGCDPEEAIMNAFACFDPDGSVLRSPCVAVCGTPRFLYPSADTRSPPSFVVHNSSS